MALTASEEAGKDSLPVHEDEAVCTSSHSKLLGRLPASPLGLRQPPDGGQFTVKLLWMSSSLTVDFSHPGRCVWPQLRENAVVESTYRDKVMPPLTRDSGDLRSSQGSELLLLAHRHPHFYDHELAGFQHSQVAVELRSLYFFLSCSRSVNCLPPLLLPSF